MSLFGEVDNGLFIEGPFLFPWLPGLLTSSAGCWDVLKTDMDSWQLSETLSLQTLLPHRCGAGRVGRLHSLAIS